MFKDLKPFTHHPTYQYALTFSILLHCLLFGQHRVHVFGIYVACLYREVDLDRESITFFKAAARTCHCYSPLHLYSAEKHS